MFQDRPRNGETGWDTGGGEEGDEDQEKGRAGRRCHSEEWHRGTPKAQKGSPKEVAKSGMYEL